MTLTWSAQRLRRTYPAPSSGLLSSLMPRLRLRLFRGPEACSARRAIEVCFSSDSNVSSTSRRTLSSLSLMRAIRMGTAMR